MAGLEPYIPWIVLGVTGLIAGWIVGLVLGGGGLLKNLIVGVLGALLGGFLVNQGLINLPFDLGSFGNGVAVATIGAFVLVILARIFLR